MKSLLAIQRVKLMRMVSPFGRFSLYDNKPLPLLTTEAADNESAARAAKGIRNARRFIFFLFIKEPLLAKINIYILIFNLLPVYPLDGSKLLLLFLSYFIDYQKAMQIQIKVSLLFICILWIITKQIGRKIILGYLFYQVILYLKNYRLIYMETLMSDHLSKKRVKINKHLEYFRPYQNMRYVRNYRNRWKTIKS